MESCSVCWFLVFFQHHVYDVFFFVCGYSLFILIRIFCFIFYTETQIQDLVLANRLLMPLSYIPSLEF